MQTHPHTNILITKQLFTQCLLAKIKVEAGKIDNLTEGARQLLHSSVANVIAKDVIVRIIIIIIMQLTSDYYLPKIII